MPRFYVDVRDGELLVPDPEGHEFPDLLTVQKEAARIARQLATDVLREARDVAIEVRSEAGQRVLSVAVAITVSLA